MILSRVIEHVKKQHWTAVFIDFVIVVLGVLLAQQISNWAQTRSERSQLDQELVTLDAAIQMLGGHAE